MVHCDVFGELLGVAGVRGAVAELLVAARDESWVEQTDILEDFAADEQTAGWRELLMYEILLDRKASVVVVAGGVRSNMTHSRSHPIIPRHF